MSTKYKEQKGLENDAYVHEVCVDEPDVQVTRFGGPDDSVTTIRNTSVKKPATNNSIDNGGQHLELVNHTPCPDDVKITIVDDSCPKQDEAMTVIEDETRETCAVTDPDALTKCTDASKTASWKMSSFKGWTREDIIWLEKVEARFTEIAGHKANINFEQFTRALGVKKSSFYAERIFKLFDQDNSGTIELGELFDGLHMLTKGTPCEKLQFLFDIYDADGNGSIDKEELQQVLKACMEESAMLLSEANFESLTEAMFAAMDTDDDGSITFEELKAELAKNPETLEKLTISAAQLLGTAQSTKKKTYCRHLTKTYLKNNCRKVAYVLIYWALNIVLFALAMWQYRESNTWIMIARGGGLCLNFNCMWVLVLMLRNCLTFLRTTFLAHVLPIDQHVCFHKMTAAAIVGFTVIHTLAHIANAAIVANANVMEIWEVLFTVKAGVGYVAGSAFITGWLLDIVLIIIVICSLPFVRRGGHFQVFYWSHLLYVPFWILVILHGPHFWKWFIGPGAIFIIEKISRSKAFRLARHGETFIKEVNLLPSRVTHLVIDRPANFRYKPGDYLFIQIPEIATHEWHPFTISSAPEMKGHIWLHVRSAGHWTNKLYDYFDNLKVSESDNNEINGVGRENSIDNFEKAYVFRATRMDSSKNLFKTSLKPKQNHKKVEIKCYLDGPYGTGTREVFETEHAVLVGAGIGITPMASILQSVWYRFSATKRQCPNCLHVWYPEISTMKLKKVDFIWVNRDQKSFEWFVSLLKQIEHEQIKHHGLLENCIQIHMYMTTAQKKTDVKGIGLQVALDLMYEKTQTDLITGLRTKTQPGRPDWNQIFTNIKKENKGKVKVFICGPPTLGEAVKEVATKHRIPFSKENF